MSQILQQKQSNKLYNYFLLDELHCGENLDTMLYDIIITMNKLTPG